MFSSSKLNLLSSRRYFPASTWVDLLLHKSKMFRNKVALITGASSGIGEATAVEFAQHGCSVALCGRNMNNLQRTASLCEQAGLAARKILIVPGDVTSEQQVQAVVLSTIDKFGRLDILVNNAGILATSNILSCDMANFDKMLNGNTRSMVLVTKYAVPYLIQTKGSIVNVSSFSGIRPTEGVLFYAMAKTACDQFTRIISVELAKKGVRVNSVNPAVIKTDIHYRSGMDETAYQKYLADQQILTPLGRYGQPEEVARAIRFLASDEASFISGAVIPIDGARSNVTPRQAGPAAKL